MAELDVAVCIQQGEEFVGCGNEVELCELGGLSGGMGIIFVWTLISI